jgi:hypothetical protein
MNPTHRARRRAQALGYAYEGRRGLGKAFFIQNPKPKIRILDKSQAIHYSFFIQRSIILHVSHSTVMSLTPPDSYTL